MSLRPKPYLSPEDYLALERNAELKSEYFDGDMFAMAGASESHNLIVADRRRAIAPLIRLLRISDPWTAPVCEG